jgi:hypothetical protein
MESNSLGSILRLVMTVIKGELNDPNTGEISVSNDGETAIIGVLDSYDDNLDYLDVNGLRVDDPVEIDFLDSSVRLVNMPVDEVSHFRYSGREYDADLFDDIIMETESMRRAPSVVPLSDGYEVVDGNSYFEAFREERDEDIWVRVHDYSPEEALDHFLSDHIPGSEAELEERNSGENWYTDSEIRDTLDNIYLDTGTVFDPSEMEEKYRIEFNLDRRI